MVFLVGEEACRSEESYFNHELRCMPFGTLHNLIVGLIALEAFLVFFL